ncbi:hypothetical protein [Microbacterium sp. CCH5-D1]|uniref:hypothetical protein n=1 Tax=Microbacterium sp. CCH5-D1 TaxID=1768780 RepID=UPI0012FB0048|nr:hypothetical protein [Microbacterium sp. CCH5-D1]
MPPARNPLRDHLIEAAAETARSVLDNVHATDRLRQSTSAIHAGMSLEFLLRAVVADLAPALVFAVRNQSEAVMRVMVSAQQKTELDLAWLHEQRSAEASTIRAAAERLIPALEALRTEIAGVVKHRDSAVHMYSAATADNRQAAATLTRVASLVLKHLGHDDKQFWASDRMDLVGALLDEHDDARRADVAVRVRACRLKAEGLAERLADNAEFVFQQMEAQETAIAPLGWAKEPADCPACERLGTLWVKGEHDYLDLADIEVELDEEGLLSGALVPQEVASVVFGCPVCGLALNNDEIGAAYPHLLDVDVDVSRISAGEYREIVEMYLPH